MSYSGTIIKSQPVFLHLKYHRGGKNQCLQNHLAEKRDLIFPNLRDIEFLFQMQDYYMLQNLFHLFKLILFAGLEQSLTIISEQ